MLPIAGYVSTLRVRDEGGESVVEWESSFEPKSTSNFVRSATLTVVQRTEKLFAAS